MSSSSCKLANDQRPREVISAASSGAVKAPELANSATCRKTKRSHGPPAPLTDQGCHCRLHQSCVRRLWQGACDGMWWAANSDSLKLIEARWSSLKLVARRSGILWKFGLGVGPSNERALLKSKGHCLSFCKVARPKCWLDRSFLSWKKVQIRSEYFSVLVGNQILPFKIFQKMTSGWHILTRSSATQLGNLSVPRRKSCSCLL